MKILNAIKSFFSKIFKSENYVFYVGSSENLPKAYTPLEEQEKNSRITYGKRRSKG